MSIAEAGLGEALPLAPSTGPLLLADQEVGSRTMLRNALATRGFEVVAVASGRAAVAAAAERPFAFAVVEMRLGDGSGLALVEQLCRLNEATQVVVVTGFDSFASVVAALRAGAVDYLPKPADPERVMDALLGRRTTLVPAPDTPLGIDRVLLDNQLFEHRNVTRTAQQLRMHRRTLQRMLGQAGALPTGTIRCCERNGTSQTVKVLALGFLIMIGMALVAEGFGAHVSKATSTPL